MRDTSPEMEARYRRMILERSPEERLKMAGSMYATARALVVTSILEANPSASPVELRLALFLRFYGHEFNAAARERILARLRSSSSGSGGTMESRDILERATRWASGRGWRRKLAKRRQYEQSLFEHSLIELDVLLAILPVLGHRRHYGLDESEQKVLAVAVLAHDVGKETDEWQAYIGGRPSQLAVSHVRPDLTRAVVPELCGLLGFADLSEPVHRIMAHCAEFHHSRPGRSDGAIVEAMLTGGSDRFLTLAHLVKAIDHFCSAASASEATECITSDPSLGKHIVTTRHELIVRGVSTTMLHRGAQTAFEQAGWTPLLYFANATVYGADAAERQVVPRIEEVEQCVKTELNAAIARDVTALMVGGPSANILPKPDLFAFNESRQYLTRAAEKIGPQSLAKKPMESKAGKGKRKIVADYLRRKGVANKPTDSEVEEQAGRLSVAQPEMMVFRFFKAMVDPKKLPVVGADGAALAKVTYERVFGEGSWKALQSTSTLDPAADMARNVDRYWNLPGEAVGFAQVRRVAELSDQTRVSALIDLLDGMAQTVYTAIGRPAPRDEMSRSMAIAFVRDMVQPAASGDVREAAAKQLDHYTRSKPFAGSESAEGVYFCPACNAAARDTVKASADFIEKPESHTNRGVAHGRFDYLMVCRTCYYERVLFQVLLGPRPSGPSDRGDVIMLLPRLNLGPGKGERFLHDVRDWVEQAKGMMRADAGAPESGFSLAFTDQAASRLGDRDPFELGARGLLAMFSYRFTGDTQKKRRREAFRRLQEEFDEDLNAVNTACGESFPAWEAAVDALIENRVSQQDFRVIRREVFRLHETLQVISHTPNIVFIPLAYEIAGGKDESETSKALRRLYVALVLSLVFDASVAIQKEGDPLSTPMRTGAAHVPAVPAVRSLVGYDWLPFTEATRWVTAIGAAAVLARDSGLPARSALYQVLASDPAERIVRRIEESGNGTLTERHLRLIERLPGFRSPRKEALL